MTTRVFKRKGQKHKGSLSVSLSFYMHAEAVQVARALDKIKARAAINGESFSSLVGAILIDASKWRWTMPTKPAFNAMSLALAGMRCKAPAPRRGDGATCRRERMARSPYCWQHSDKYERKP